MKKMLSGGFYNKKNCIKSDLYYSNTGNKKQKQNKNKKRSDKNRLNITVCNNGELVLAKTSTMRKKNSRS